MYHKIDATIKQALGTFKNADKAFLEGYVMLLYISNAHSILFTQKSVC